MNTSTTSEHSDMIQIPYPLDLYRFDTAAEGISGGFSAITEADIEYFHRYGYLVINDAFNPTEVEDALGRHAPSHGWKVPGFPSDPI